MTLFGFGTATVDFRIHTADLGLGYTEKLLARGTDIFGGGAIANCLVQAARLDVHCRWLGKLGRDAIGKTIIDLLEREGIDCSDILIDPESISPFNLAAYAGEARRRLGGYLLPNSLAHLSDTEIAGLASAVTADDWVVVEVGEIPLPSVLDFCGQVKKRGAHLAVDVDLDPILQCGAAPELVEEIFARQDLILASAEPLQTLYPGDSAGQLATRLSAHSGASVVVTAGARGAYTSKDGGPADHTPSLAVEAVDSVGAGDAFNGGLLSAVLRGKSLSEAVQTGSACGALNCLSFGAREGMPDSTALKAFISRH